jgi:hypothetical protein
MSKIRKDDRNREQRRRAIKGFHSNVYCKKYENNKNRLKAYNLFKGII